MDIFKSFEDHGRLDRDGKREFSNERQFTSVPRICFYAVAFICIAASLKPPINWAYFWITAGAFSIAAFVVELVTLGLNLRTLEIDFDAKTVTIESYVYPTMFFDILPKARVVIGFDDIESVEFFDDHRYGRYVTVRTSESRFVLHPRVANRDELVSYLCEIAGQERTVADRQHRILIAVCCLLIPLLMLPLIFVIVKFDLF